MLVSSVSRLFGALRNYSASDDARVATGNLIALVLAWNTPFYPLYLRAAGGAAMLPGAWLTLSVFPVFLAVPAITARYPFGGRVLLASAAVTNTFFCTWLLGEASGTQLFILPCITLAALLFRWSDRVALTGFLALPILVGILTDGRYPVSPFICTGDRCRAILWMNALSVVVLTAFFGILATRLADECHVD
jgi:MASE7 protein